MATKIRLARHGHKDYAYYHIVVADSRSPRDGKYIERIGSYNPNNNPAKVDLKFDRALYWVNVGAQPTDTVRNILSGEGVMLMKHLNGGVAKGAFSAEEAQKRFDAWKAQKDAKNGIEFYHSCLLRTLHSVCYKLFVFYCIRQTCAGTHRP